MILPIYTYGQPVLRKVAEDITPDYPELATLIENMFETMDHADGVGLAAPLKDEKPEYAGFNRAYINLHIVEVDDSHIESYEEGCLSLPGIHEPVKRPTRIHVTYLDPDFQPHDEWVDGFLARVMQHEYDHLEGKVFTDRLTPLRKQMVRSKLSSLLKGNFRCGYKVKMKK